MAGNHRGRFNNIRWRSRSTSSSGFGPISGNGLLLESSGATTSFRLLEQGGFRLLEQ